MKFYCVWTLRRGAIPSERVSDADEWELNRDYVMASIERDPPLTMEQRWLEDGARMGYRKKRQTRRAA